MVSKLSLPDLVQLTGHYDQNINTAYHRSIHVVLLFNQSCVVCDHVIFATDSLRFEFTVSIESNVSRAVLLQIRITLEAKE